MPVTRLSVLMLGALCVALPALAPVAALAQTDAVHEAPRMRYDLGVTAGTLGVGPEVGVRFGRHVGVRANATFLKFDRSLTVDGNPYDFSPRLQSYGVAADLYPLGGAWRISLGGRVNRSRVGLRYAPTGTVNVGGVNYSLAQAGTINGTVRAADLQPMLTTGFSGHVAKHILLNLDAGVTYQKSPYVSDLSANGSLASDPTFQANLASERQKINDKLHPWTLYPVVQLGVGYEF